MELSTETKKILSYKSIIMFFLCIFLSFFVVSVTFLSLVGINVIPQSLLIDRSVLAIFICALFSFQIAVWVENGIRPNILKLLTLFLIISLVFVIDYQYLGYYAAILCMIRITRLDELIL